MKMRSPRNKFIVDHSSRKNKEACLGKKKGGLLEVFDKKDNIKRDTNTSSAMAC